MKCLFVGVVVTGTREGMCKMVAGASVDCLALMIPRPKGLYAFLFVATLAVG